MDFKINKRLSRLSCGLAIFLLIMSPGLNLVAFTVSGHVQDFVTGKNLSQVNVVLISNEHAIRDTVTTNYLGQWEYTSASSGLLDQHTLPHDFSVQQNFPNPFNPTTKIEFGIAAAGEVEIAVYNILGQVLGAKKQFLEAGNYQVEWRSTGAAGVYFYTVSCNDKAITKKMVQLDGGGSGGLTAISGASFRRENTLSKPVTVPLTIIYDKFAYVADTVAVEIAGGEYFDVTLETIHNSLTLIDLHNDVLEQMLIDTAYHWMPRHTYHHTDIPRLIEGGVDVQFFVIWIDPRDGKPYQHNPYQGAQVALGLFNRELNLYPEFVQQARTLDEALAINLDNKIAAVMCVEGGHVIENDINKLIQLYDDGMCYLTITWNNSTDWAVSAQDARSSSVGLNDFGRQVIQTLDSLGVIIDVSHVGIKTVSDILETTVNPIVATHSGARAICDHYRNLYDEQIEAIAAGGGVVGIVFYPYFISGSRTASIEQVIEHIEHIVNLVGIDHVALGSDFDGIERTVTGLEDVSKFPNLTYVLLERGYSREEVAKILGGNFQRVFRQVCAKTPT